MKTLLRPLVLGLILAPGLLLANTAPTVVIESVAMRPGTTLMDVVYRVNDPDDVTVKTRALAFVDGMRSFAKVLRPVTFAEGTEIKLGDAILTNTSHTITWDVAADWNIQLGQVKFEVLAMDARGLLAFDWITIPAAAGKPALAISKDSPSDASVLNALFWQYASGDPALSVGNGVLTANPNGGIFSGLNLANGTALQTYSLPYILKKMNLVPADAGEVSYAVTAARAGLLSTTKWHAVNRSSPDAKIIFAWGDNSKGQTTIPAVPAGTIAIAAGGTHSLVLKNDGTVAAWGENNYGQSTVPSDLSGVISISAGKTISLALKSDGTVVAWGQSFGGQIAVPSGLAGVIAIAAGSGHSLALKNDGTVVGWGANAYAQSTPPAGLTEVIAVAAGTAHSLALKSDGTLVAWGANSNGSTTIPNGLTGVTAIAAGDNSNLALKSDGTVVAWGSAANGVTTVPSGLTDVIAIKAGEYHALALKSDGTVVAWGSNSSGQTTIPAGLTGVTAVAAGGQHSVAIKSAAE